MELAAEMFRQGGIWMYLVLGLSMIVYPVFLGAIVIYGLGIFGDKARRKMCLIAAGLSLVGALALVMVGTVGWYVGLSDMQAAVAMASPEHAAEMRERGRAMAMYPLQAGGVAAVLPGVGGIVFLLTGLLSGGDEPGES